MDNLDIELIRARLNALPKPRCPNCGSDDTDNLSKGDRRRPVHVHYCFSCRREWEIDHDEGFHGTLALSSRLPFGASRPGLRCFCGLCSQEGGRNDEA